MRLALPLLLLALAPLALVGAVSSATIHAGDMSCEPAAGAANSAPVALGAATADTYTLEANGTVFQDDQTCTFEIGIGAPTFYCPPGLLGPCGGVTAILPFPCTVTGPASCTTTTDFTWWRADHAVAFDLPFTLYVNGAPVASGTFRFIDPPLVPTTVL